MEPKTRHRITILAKEICRIRTEIGLRGSVGPFQLHTRVVTEAIVVMIKTPSLLLADSC